ncbi:hypothetical protein [Amycolatopsis pittospori]|uniref:hypothetical protein n=1 Tax=Amycolatopsis pittospori TaxID=2749434 RepID=UPI0015F04304|nr:hypothetical protein [Amycolatopsis pittospori]
MTETQADQATTDAAQESGEETFAAMIENPDVDTPVFNETVYDLRGQLPSLAAHVPPAAPEEASDQTADDSGDGDQG